MEQLGTLLERLAFPQALPHSRLSILNILNPGSLLHCNTPFAYAISSVLHRPVKFAAKKRHFPVSSIFDCLVPDLRH
ncbi:MAG: hypothetical protein WCA64_03885 [Gallionella sp.]